MDKQHTEQVEKLSDNMDKLTNSLADGLNLLKQLLQPQILDPTTVRHQGTAAAKSSSCTHAQYPGGRCACTEAMHQWRSCMGVA